MKKKKSKKVSNNVRQQEDNRVTNGALDNALFAGGAFPYNYGVQLSQTETLWRNLRWYLISNQRNLLSQSYVEHGLIQTICRVPVEDALRGWVEIKTKQLDERQIQELQSKQEYDGDQGETAEAGTWQRLYGGGGLLILTGQDWMTPLDVDALYGSEFLRFKAVDMWELFYSMQNIEGDGEPLDYGDTEYYNYYGKQVHHSRVLIMKGMDAPSFIRPRLRGWGMSVCEPLVRSINQYLKSNNLTFEVLDEFKLDIFKFKNLASTLMVAGGEQKVAARTQTANRNKNYLNSLVLDSEDDYIQKQLSFAGLAEAQAGIRMQVASDMRMPLTKLFGISAAGFNSGEDDIEVYNGMIESEVRSRMKYPILRMIELRCVQLFGFIPDDLTISFKPLRILSAEQEENVKDKKFTRLMSAKERGLISTDEFRDGCNREQLLPIQVTGEVPLDEQSEDAVETGEMPEDRADIDIERESERTLAAKKAKEAKPPKRNFLDKIVEKFRKDAHPEPSFFALINSDFKESDHPRDSDGKFQKGGSSSESKESGSTIKRKELEDNLDKLKKEDEALWEKVHAGEMRGSDPALEESEERLQKAEKDLKDFDAKQKDSAKPGKTSKFGIEEPGGKVQWSERLTSKPWKSPSGETRIYFDFPEFKMSGTKIYAKLEKLDPKDPNSKTYVDLKVWADKKEPLAFKYHRKSDDVADFLKDRGVDFVKIEKQLEKEIKK